MTKLKLLILKKASNDNHFTLVEYCKQRNEGFKNDIQWIGKMLGFEISEQIPPELPPKKGNNENMIAELNSLKAQLEDQKSINQALDVAKLGVVKKLLIFT